MGNKIILSFQPFDLRQNIVVVNKEGTILYQTTANSTVDELMNAVKGLVAEYQAKDIIIHGSKGILQQYVATLKASYGFEDLNIVIM